MIPTNRKPKPKTQGMHRSTKFLLAACASAATLSGWAWLTLTAPPPQLDAEEEDVTDVALVVPTQAVTDEVRVAMVTTPFPGPIALPKLDQLPVRGLRYVGDFVPTAAVPVPAGVTLVPPAPDQVESPQATPPSATNQKKEKVDAPAPQPQAPQPAPTKEPKPKHKTKSSK